MRAKRPLQAQEVPVLHCFSSPSSDRKRSSQGKAISHQVIASATQRLNCLPGTILAKDGLLWALIGRRDGKLPLATLTPVHLSDLPNIPVPNTLAAIRLITAWWRFVRRHALFALTVSLAQKGQVAQEMNRQPGTGTQLLGCTIPCQFL